jgi:GTP-binding protein
VTHFRREKFVPKGGPDGGDGGRGGHIVLRGNKQLWTLLHLKYRKHVVAEDGGRGGKQNSFGKQGKDEILEVPLGTVVKDPETGKVIHEITEDKEEFIVVAGGKPGIGNSHFKSSTNQAPRKHTQGQPRKEEWKVLELKLLADVGLVGYPNAGKSTLLSVLSAAKPKIADYPFTTLQPNLGIVAYNDYRSFVMADIPGIIEGAHKGKGLGFRFLRHIERNAVLLFIVPVDANNIRDEYNTLLKEVEAYNRELLVKPRLLGISKADLADEEIKKLASENLQDIHHLYFSAIQEEGLQQLKNKLWELLNMEV